MCWLQDAMRKAEAAGTEECPVKIKLVAPPLYVLTTQTLDKVGGHKQTFYYVSGIFSLYACTCHNTHCRSLYMCILIL